MHNLSKRTLDQPLKSKRLPHSKPHVDTPGGPRPHLTRAPRLRRQGRRARHQGARLSFFKQGRRGVIKSVVVNRRL